MADSFQEQLTKVKALGLVLDILEKQTEDVRCELVKEQKLLQEMCTHDFVAESDGDYHKPGYYYVCKSCKYFTRVKPVTKNV